MTYQHNKAKLLLPEQEIELGRKVRKGLDAKDELEKNTAMTPAVRRKLRQAVAEGEVAKTEFVEANVGLVFNEVRKYKPIGCEMDDLIQEGNLGLMHAVDKFDPEKGFRFSTYGVWWIRQAVERGASVSGSMLKLSGTVQNDLKKMRRSRRDLLQTFNREPTDEEIAERSDMDIQRIEKLRAWEMSTRSLDSPLKSDDTAGMTLMDTLSDADSDDEYERVEIAGIESVIDKMKSVLNEDETHVLETYFLTHDRYSRRMSKKDRHIWRRAKAKLLHPSSDVALIAASYL